MLAEHAGSSLLGWRPRLVLDELKCALFLGMVGIMGGWSVACSPVQPIDEPGMSDLQLTVDTLKTSIRDSQRTIAELRAEADSRRRELAELHIGRAQLEGRIREAERRLSEARHVIELQREELAGSHFERDRASRTGARLHSQLNQSPKQLAAVSTSAVAGMTSLSSLRGQGTERPSVRDNQHDWIEDSDTAGSTSARAWFQSTMVDGGSPATHPVRIVVKRGDTLWSIAQRYQMPLRRLMAINGLVDHQIQAGQVLWLAESPASSSRAHEAAE